MDGSNNSRLKSPIAGYDYSVISLADWQRQRSRLLGEHQRQPDRAMLAFGLNEYTFQLLRHDDRNRVRWSENWLQWLVGQFYEPAQHLQLPEQIKNRRAGLCSEAATVLQDELQKAGIPSRMVGLNGHVVLEYQDQDQWKMLDPDFGLAASFSVEQLAAAAANRSAPWLALRAELLERGFSESAVQTYQEILASAVDNQTLPVGTALNPRLTLLARWTHWLSPFLALGMAWLGARILIKQVNRPAKAAEGSQESTAEG